MTAAETSAFEALLTDDRYGVHVVLARDPGTPADADPPLPSLPYVLIYPTGGRDEQHRSTGPHVTRRPSWVVHAVGESSESAELVLGFVDDHLRPPPSRWGVIPVVVGQRTKRIRRDDVVGVQVDDSSTPVVCYAIAAYSFESSPDLS